MTFTGIVNNIKGKSSMKAQLIQGLLLGSFCSSVAFAQLKDIHKIGQVLDQDNQLVQSSLLEIQSAHEQTNYLFKVVTTQDQKERLRYVNDRLNNAENLLRQLLMNPPVQPPPYQPPQPAPETLVEMYNSDTCSGSLVGRVNPGTSCQSYAGAAAVWGIKVNGRCIDTLDLGAVQACETFKDAANPNTIRLFKSDTCNNSLSAIVSTATNCESLASDQSAWAVSIGGQCKDLDDTSPRLACRALRGAVSQNAVEIYKSDTCNGSLLAIVDRYTQCQSLQGLGQAWGIKVNGQCQDISDTDIVSACNRFKP